MPESKVTAKSLLQNFVLSSTFNNVRWFTSSSKLVKAVWVLITISAIGGIAYDASLQFAKYFRYPTKVSLT
jgi:uncharacterized membrane protein